MKFQKLFSTTVIALLIISCSGKSTKSNKESDTAKRPNIIFFIADDMYPEMFNCLPEGKGKNLTPNMDRLVAEGTLMKNQLVASPVCTPSRYNCLTGNYASKATNKAFTSFTKEQEGQTVIHWNTFITNGNKALPHYLKELGYTTGMVGKNHAIEAGTLYHFPDYWADAKAPEIVEKLESNYNLTVQAILDNGFDYADGIYHDNPNFVGLGELAVQNTDWIAEAGVNFIEKNYKRPFYLYFATTIPHAPTEPKRSWNANPLITAKGYLEKAPNVMPVRHTIPERTKAEGLEGKGKENLLWLDDALGALIHKLEDRNILDNTIIFFFNDHGQKAKGTLYQGGVMSPSIVWQSKGFKCGNICNTKVQNIDFAPTIVEMAGGNVEENQFDGQSFKALLDGETLDAERTFFFELGYARAIIKGDYKYYAIRYPAFAKNRTKEERATVLEGYNSPRIKKKMGTVNLDNPMAPYSHFSLVPGGEQAEHASYGQLPGYFDMDQLYNLKEDPKEQNNLFNDPSSQQVLNELKAELKKHLASMPGKFDI
ncbi:sulfatase family protein [Labilibacter marinus]|uniref:sulfatase family protein n=1 Tax=Labilibacter marinus TaxID=1477105 RepID=UPI00094FA5B1|nr:sulfatase-like hydrolase/transferase [Labilibacter marinus]